MEKKYIDAEEFKSRLAAEQMHFSERIKNPAFHILSDIPAADVVPVVHGHWIKRETPTVSYEYCSNCGCVRTGHTTHFCANCGADMRQRRA